MGCAVALWLAAAMPADAGATSYDPLTPGGEQAPAEMAKGAAVHLFSSGNEQMAKSLHAGDVLTILGRTGGGEATPVGSIRVTALVGKTCVAGEVVEGTVRVNDLAVKDGVYFLVIPAALCTE
jgi:ribosomal protein S28E/S33